MASEAVKEIMAELEGEAKPGVVNAQCSFIVTEIDDLERQLDSTTNVQQRKALAIRISALERYYIQIGCGKVQV